MKPDIILPPPPATAKPVQVPLDLIGAPALINGRRGKDDDPVIDACLRAAVSLRDEAEKLPTTYCSIVNNQMAMPAKRAADAKKAVAAIRSRTLAKLTDARDKVEHAISKLREAMLPSPPRDTLAVTLQLQSQEIRSMLRSLKPDERIRAVRTAVEQTDAVFVHAVINGSPLLTGLGAAEIQVAKHMWASTHHGDTVVRVERLNACLGDLDRLTRLFDKWSGQIGVDKNASIAAAETSARLANEALASAGGDA